MSGPVFGGRSFCENCRTQKASRFYRHVVDGIEVDKDGEDTGAWLWQVQEDVLPPAYQGYFCYECSRPAIEIDEADLSGALLAIAGARR